MYNNGLKFIWLSGFWGNQRIKRSTVYTFQVLFNLFKNYLFNNVNIGKNGNKLHLIYEILNVLHTFLKFHNKPLCIIKYNKK